MRKIKGHVALIQFSDFGLGRGLYLAKALSLLGLKVTIITNEPVYISTQRFSGDSTLNYNTKVIEFRIPFAKTLYRSILGRLIVDIIFTMFSFFEIFMVNPQPKTLYARTTPFTEISCLFYKFFNRNVKIISDTTDLYPDGLEYIKMNPVLKRILIAVGHSINHSIYSNVDAIVTLNATMGKILQERFKRDVYILNGVIDLNRFRPVDRKDAFGVLSREISTTMLGKFVVLYAGVMSPFQDPLVIADIAEQMQNESRDVVFVVVGSGPLKQELKNTVQKKDLSNVLILNVVTHEVMPYIYNIADLTLVPPPLLSVPGMYEFFIHGLPKKFIEYSACGKPILCITPPCLASELCLKWNAGYHVLPQNANKVGGIIKALKENKELKEQIGKNARQLAEEMFSIQNATKILKKVIIENAR